VAPVKLRGSLEKVAVPELAHSGKDSGLLKFGRNFHVRDKWLQGRMNWKKNRQIFINSLSIFR
jgi:protein gp37